MCAIQATHPLALGGSTNNNKNGINEAVEEMPNAMVFSACADVDAAGTCLATTAPVDLADCSWSTTAGSPELRADWVDPNYDPSHNAFYYARVMQIPTCRWTTYDSLRLRLTPPSDVPATITEMAWSSPIWMNASDQ